MDKKRPSELAMEAAAEERAVAGRPEFMPVPIVEAPGGGSVSDDILAMLPANMREKVEVFDSSLPASPAWDKPGQFLEGEFIGIRLDVGPNNSRVYELLTTVKGARPKLVAVWGSTILDQQFERARVNPGDHVLIVYRGEQETSRKQNPVRLFDVAVIRKG